MMPVAILAGGLATRLLPLTESIPKVLLNVAGKPFLAHQLAYLREQGIERVVLCVGHLGETIEAQFGDGRDWGVHLEYSYDGPALLGTGGALRNALPLLGDEFFVLYGDSYLPIDFAAVARSFRDSGRAGLMTVYRNENRWDASNVWFSDGRIRSYDKKNRLPEMRHIDYGLSVLSAPALHDLPNAATFDLAEVFARLVERRELAGFEASERFYEIGSLSGLAELEEYLRRSPAAVA